MFDKKWLKFPPRFAIMPLPMQDSYIGNTTASQAVKAGSTPVSCSICKATQRVAFSYGIKQRVSNRSDGNSLEDCCSRGLDRGTPLCSSQVKENANRRPYPAPAKDEHSFGGAFVFIGNWSKMDSFILTNDRILCDILLANRRKIVYNLDAKISI